MAYDDIAVLSSTPQAGDLCFDQHALQVRWRHTPHIYDMQGSDRVVEYDHPVGSKKFIYHMCVKVTCCKWGVWWLVWQRYILHCSQALEGGLRDKPGK